MSAISRAEGRTDVDRDVVGQLALVGLLVKLEVDGGGQRRLEARTFIADGVAIEVLERVADLDQGSRVVADGQRIDEAEAGAIQQLQTSRQRFETDVAKTVESLDKLDAHAVEAAQKRIKELTDGNGADVIYEGYGHFLPIVEFGPKMPKNGLK